MKTRQILLVAAGALLLTGCIISATYQLEVPVTVKESFINGIVKETLNLSEEDDTWADHQDDINRIEKVNFDAVVDNDGGEVTLNVYVAESSTYASRAEVEDAYDAGDALAVLLGYVAPADSWDTLTVAESEALLQLSGDNFTKVQNLLLTGNFTVYVTSTDAVGGTIDTANVYITFTAGK